MANISDIGRWITENAALLSGLACDNQSSDPEMQFFSDGVSDEIIQRLSRGAPACVPGWASSSSGWQRANGRIVPTKFLTISKPSAPTRNTFRKKNSGLGCR